MGGGHLFFASIFAFVFLCVSAFPLDQNNVFIRGNKTNINSKRYMISIFNKNKFVCAAVLVAHKYVLTVASCVHGFNAKNPPLTIIAGSNKVKPLPHSECGKQVVKVKNIIIHEGFKPDSIIDNIAILQLEHNLCYTKCSIHPIVIAVENPRINDVAYVNGWGTDQTNKNGTLRAASLKIVNPNVCKKQYNKNMDTSFCTAGKKNEGPGKGDLGDPAHNKFNRLVGLFQHPPNPDQNKGRPNVFTNVVHYTPWLQKKIPDF